MKRALAVLSAAIAVAACHVTVVPVPVRPVEHSTADAGHDRRPPVVVVVDPRDSARIHREHRRDDADDSVAENGKTDHRPDWAAKPHDGGRTALPPGLAKEDDGPPGQARTDTKPDKGEHGPPEKAGRPDEHGAGGEHAEAPGQEKKADHAAQGEHGNNGKAAEHGQGQSDHAGKAAEEHGKAGAAGQAEHGKAGEHGNAAAARGNGDAEAGSKSTEHGNAANPDKAGPSNHGATAQRGSQAGQSGQGARSGGKSGEAGKAAKADQARQVVTPERTDKGNQAVPANQFAERSAPSTKPSDTNLGPDNKGKTAESAKADRAAASDHGAKVEQSRTAHHGAKAEQGAGAERARTTGTSGAAPRRPPPQAPPAPTAAIPVATVPQLVGSSSLVGRRVRVTGTCVAAKDQSAMGSAPTGRGDWQLVADRVAIWVAGPRPAGCTAAGGSAKQVTLTATVAQDQLPGHGKKAGETRRYLVVR